jgi:hypothetical protein
MDTKMFNENNKKLIEMIESNLPLLEEQKTIAAKFHVYEKTAMFLDIQKKLSEIKKDLEAQYLPAYFDNYLTNK